mgnify:CR=1 FL=1
MPTPAEIKKTAMTIKHCRELAGLTQVEAAKVVGYSVSHLQKFESGRYAPPERAIKPIIEALTDRIKKGVSK